MKSTYICFYIFERLLSSPMMHLFDKKYSNSDIVKYDYSLI